MKKKDNVLILMPQLFMGGSERQVRYIAEGLENAKVSVTVLVENGTASDDENKEYILEHIGIQFVFLEMNTLNVQNKTVVNKTKSLVHILRWISKYGKNYSWCMFTNLTGLMCVPLCKEKKMKVLFNERNPGVKMCNTNWKKWLLKCCNKVVANSKSAAEYMSNVLQLKVECINNGILEKNLPSCTKTPDELYILVPARINPIKNQMVILRAIGNLRGNIKIKCCFAGQIEDENYYQQLLKYTRDEKLGDMVSFPGYVKNIDELYSKADMIILSSYEEGTPNVILEAYLNKKPCLASDIVMNRNIATDNRILFDVNNDKMLAEKIEWLINIDIATKTTIIEKSYIFVKEHYSIEAMQNKYIDIFTNGKAC